jgi:osmotically-inducible protein OsmY
VQEVVSRISVKQPEVSADEIKSAVERALVRIAELDAANVRIAVEIGHVVLTGTVHTVAEREQAEAAAWRASGVTRVTNQIEVRPDAHLT